MARLRFLQPSKRGSSMHTVTIEGDKVHAISPEGQKASITIRELIKRAKPRRMDSCGVIIPNGVRLMYSDGPISIWVHESPACVVRLKWIDSRSRARYGPGTRYRMVRIALPYLVVLAVFQHGVLTDANECFFRVRELSSENDELLYPALLNCSRFQPPDGRPLSWICSQRMDRTELM